MEAPLSETFETVIEKIVTGGRGLGRLDGQAVFVPATAPGDRVRARVVARRRGWIEAEALEVLEPSPDRRRPPCPHESECGGCDLQFLRAEAQRRVKHEIVLDCFRRLGGLEVEGLLEGPDPAGPEFGYRDRLRLFADPTGRYGLRRRGSHEVVPLETCLQMPPPFTERLLPWLRTLPPMEQVVVRLDHRGGALVSLFGPASRARALRRQIDATPAGEAPVEGLVGLLHNNLPVWGRDYLVVSVAGHKFRVGPQSFFQANLAEAEAMVRTADAWLTPDDAGGPDPAGRLLVDLYCGVGLFTLALGGRWRRVLAVESDPSALRDARNNVRRDGAVGDRVDLRAGKVADVLADPGTAADPDWRTACVVADPPRAGLGKAVTGHLARLAPPDVLAVGCDPATAARDAAALVAAGYEPRRLRVFDLFPQTSHLETMLHLRRR